MSRDQWQIVALLFLLLGLEAITHSNIQVKLKQIWWNIAIANGWQAPGSKQ